MRRAWSFFGLAIAFLMVLSWVREDDRCRRCDPVQRFRSRGL